MSQLSRVLLVDDDPAALLTMQAQLRSEPHDLVVVRGGAEALQHLESAPVDLVICDLMMAHVDGLAVCRAIKAHADWRYVPIIMLTALDAHEALDRATEAGADTFLTKPIGGDALRARTRAMLRVRQMYKGLREHTLGQAETRRTEVIAAAQLTERERQVLDLLLLGRTHEDIADVLGISERTSKFHQANLLAKLGAESRLDLMRLFL